MKNVSKRPRYNKQIKKEVKEDKKEINKVYKKSYNILKPISLKNKEVKMFDFHSETNDIMYVFNNNNGILLNGMFKGAANYQRIGNRIKIKRIQYKMRILRSDVTLNATASTYFKLAMIYDSMNNSLSTPSNSVWMTCDKTGTLAAEPYSFLNSSNINRFTPICEHVYISPMPNAYPIPSTTFTYTATEQNQVYWEGDIKCDLPIIFYTDGVSGGIGDIQSGAISFFPMSPGNSPQNWNTAINVRFTFTDD